MSIVLDKKTGINLKKGSRINLEKKGKQLEKIYLGLNWGAISPKGLFRILQMKDNVDLDGSVTTFNASGDVLETIYYNRLHSRGKAIMHSGDDLTGDQFGDDGLDNEVISIDLKKIRTEAKTIFFYLNSYSKHDFADIPFAKIRIYEGTPQYVESTFATFNIANDESYKGHVSMLMGKLSRKLGNNWEFEAIGKQVKAKNIDQTIETIQEQYL